MDKPTAKVKDPLPQVADTRPTLGSDPEFFFRVNNKVVGAEHFLPKDGLIVVPKNEWRKTEAKFIIDGVQAEMNPYPAQCRHDCAYNIKACFVGLRQHLQGKDVKVCIDNTIEISEEEMAKMADEHKQLGCTPSLNAYRDTSGILAGIDPTIMRIRSGGGHIHIQIPNVHKIDPKTKQVMKEKNGDYIMEPHHIKTHHHKEFIHMLDIIVGNTCVLVDRDPGNKIRRKFYGLAGEHRLPEHGLEYRTLSNFWLKSFPLMSMAFGLVRIAFALMYEEKKWETYYKAFTEAVSLDDIERAINTNNFRLAMKNFKAIQPLLEEVTLTGGQHPISREVMDEFLFFVAQVKDHGIEKYFNQDPVEHWCADRTTSGFHEWLQTVIRKEMNDAKKAKKAEKETATTTA